MDALPLIIIFSAIIVVGLIWAALRITIKRDRSTIQSDMAAPQDVETYNDAWRKET